MRSLVLIMLCSLALANAVPGITAESDPATEASEASSAAKSIKGPDGLGKLPEEAAPEPDAVPKPAKKKGLFGKSKDSESESASEEAATEKEPKAGKKKEPPPPTAAELAQAAAAAERAKALKSMSTPFNTSSTGAVSTEGGLSPLSLRSDSGGHSLRSSLSQRLVPYRVYLPGKMMIGKAHDFVVKGRAGSHVAIAMADKDSGAKAIQGHTLRLGPDRKLMAAGTIPESGILTLIVDMPIQGDLIGLPVFFETAIWQKPDFSDLELATPVKSETVVEFADKPNAVVVAGEPGSKGRAIKFDAAKPFYQHTNDGLEPGRP